MKIANNNLVAVAYEAGYCGSLIYTLLALSPEVQQYVEFSKVDFSDGTAHRYGESWFTGLHSYNDSLTVSEDLWHSYQTEKSTQALNSTKLVIFRCHPNVAYKLSFIENLRVLSLTHRNKYLPERWAYEKIISQNGEDFYFESMQHWLPGHRSQTIDRRLRRALLIKKFNHRAVDFADLKSVLTLTPLSVHVDKILDSDYNEYQQICNYLNVSAITQDRFTQIINEYNTEQWTRF